MKNKLLVDEEVFILDDSNYSIRVSGNIKIYITDDIVNYDISIELLDNASLVIYIYTTNSKENKINITQNNNTKLEIKHSFDIKDAYKLILRTILNGDNNLSNVIINGITRGNVLLDVDGKVVESSKDNVLNETIKVLTDGGKVECLPMLHINTKNVIANHGNSISNVNEDELFYLMMKGLNRESAIKLIENGIKYGLFKGEEEFLKIIDK